MKSAGFDDGALVAATITKIERHAGRTSAPTTRALANRRAAAKAIGESGLRPGVVVEYQNHLCVVRSVDVSCLVLVALNGELRRINNVQVMVYAPENRSHRLAVDVKYVPDSGFVHVRSITYGGKSILARDNAKVLDRLRRGLGEGEKYQHPAFGEFWYLETVEAVKRILLGAA